MCVCVCTPAHGELALFLQGVPGLLFMLGPTKTMSSRRVNVPVKRGVPGWLSESAAGILNGDRTHIPVTCYMLLLALHFADSNQILVSGTTTMQRDGTLILQHIPFLGSGTRDRDLRFSEPSHPGLDET